MAETVETIKSNFKRFILSKMLTENDMASWQLTDFKNTDRRVYSSSNMAVSVKWVFKDFIQ